MSIRVSGGNLKVCSHLPSLCFHCLVPSSTPSTIKPLVKSTQLAQCHLSVNIMAAGSGTRWLSERINTSPDTAVCLQGVSMIIRCTVFTSPTHCPKRLFASCLPHQNARHNDSLRVRFWWWNAYGELKVKKKQNVLPSVSLLGSL